jgi:NADH dehydrogenase [ubiquinone] 1 alpha subcomplex assembly factor 5
VIADEDALPFADASLDLVIGNLSLHWVNDLPGALVQIRRALKPDGLFLAAMLGGDTLIELRRSLLEAELETLGGTAPRVSPFAGVRDAGDLLMRAGFTLPVADSDPLTVTYADPLALMRDLRGMGEGNALAGTGRPLRRDTLFTALRRYGESFAEPDGRIPATFEIVYLAGWSPADNQPRPACRGSATMSLADAIKAAAAPADSRSTASPSDD